MTMYKIVRKFYVSKKAMEEGRSCITYTHPFDPLTLEEANIVKPKLAPPENAIDFIRPITDES